MWKKGLVVKVFKKGDLHECNNGRGVTSLPAIKERHRQETSKGTGWVSSQEKYN